MLFPLEKPFLLKRVHHEWAAVFKGEVERQANERSEERLSSTQTSFNARVFFLKKTVSRKEGLFYGWSSYSWLSVVSAHLFSVCFSVTSSSSTPFSAFLRDPFLNPVLSASSSSLFVGQEDSFLLRHSLHSFHSLLSEVHVCPDRLLCS